MNFAERMGYVQPKGIQIDSIDDGLRNRLWNVLMVRLINKLGSYELSPQTPYDQRELFVEAFFFKIWDSFLKQKHVVYLPNEQVVKYMEVYFYDKSVWYKPILLIEFCIKLANPKLDIYLFIATLNQVLIEEKSGFRLINGQFAPITNDSEISSINEATQQTKQFSSLEACNTHLTAALQLLSDKKSPDYRNSIKESISAVEAAVRTITQKDKFSDALTEFNKKAPIHGSLVSGFKSLYGYTSDAAGIRHAIMDDTNCDLDDAKYMLVSCSAFINYLIGKALKAGISLGGEK
ncbi:AbiJ-NTD4 domain-containing protein [Runella sp.]|uniref:AbiJ-NTD4 domain-containing protein n=1 Tax=Runella sp. TaxID=1960881 RepID=UPI003D0E650B